MSTAVSWKTRFLITSLMNKHLRFTDCGQCQRESTPFRLGCIICDLAMKLLQLPSAPQGQILTEETPVFGMKLYLQ